MGIGAKHEQGLHCDSTCGIAQHETRAREPPPPQVLWQTFFIVHCAVPIHYGSACTRQSSFLSHIASQYHMLRNFA